MIYNEEAFFIHLADKRRKNTEAYSGYMEELFAIKGDNPFTAETLSAFMGNVWKTGSGTGLGAAKTAYQILEDFADFCAETGETHFVYAYHEYICQAFEKPVQKKMNEMKNKINIIPEGTKINPVYLVASGLSNEAFVEAFRQYQQFIYNVYECIEHNSPFDWGWAGWRGLTVGGIKYNRVMLTIGTLMQDYNPENDTVTVWKEDFYGYDFHKSGEGYSQEKTNLLVKGFASVGLCVEGLEDKKSKFFTVSFPGKPALLRVMHTIANNGAQNVGCIMDYRKIEDPASLPLPTDFFGLFDRKLMEYEGIDKDRGDRSKWVHNDKIIAQHWGERGKSLCVWLKNILQQEKYKDEILALPKSVQSKFKLRPRKPCPCGQCYKIDRNEKVFTYAYEGNQYEMCERRSFIFKGDDVELVPVFLRMLEMEYDLVLRKAV